MAKLSGGDTFFSLGVLPFLMALGHLSPTIGASQIATGTYQFPGALLGMLTAATTLVDCGSEIIILCLINTDAISISSGYIQRYPFGRSASKMGLASLGILLVDNYLGLHALLWTSACDTNVSICVHWFGLGNTLPPILFPFFRVSSFETENYRMSLQS